MFIAENDLPHGLSLLGARGAEPSVGGENNINWVKLEKKVMFSETGEDLASPEG